MYLLHLFFLSFIERRYQMVGLLVNYKRRGINLEELRKPQNMPIMIASHRTEIWKMDVPNANRKLQDSVAVGLCCKVAHVKNYVTKPSSSLDRDND
jgi:hypothetical protein